MINNNYNSDKKKVSIRNLFLDPNNYRFIDNKSYKKVDSEDIISDIIQKRTLNFLIGDKRKGIADLLKSYTSNGYLEVDQIQVESIGEGKYRVLEGNRRVAALKILYQDYKEHAIDLGKFSPETFGRIPIVIYEKGQSGVHEIIMGLKHISGNKKWPPLNQAQLIYDLIHQHKWEESAICDALGIETKNSLYRSLRTISLINNYRASEFGDQFETDMFGIFREIVSSRPIKSWIDWDDTEKKPKCIENTERLYSWLSSVAIIQEDQDGEEVEVSREPAITKSTEIATLAKIIDDEDALNELETKRNITDAYSASSTVGNDQYFKAITNIEHNINDANTFLKYAANSRKEKLVELKNKLEGLLVSQGHKDIVVTKEVSKRILIGYKTNQFETIKLCKYKYFSSDLEIKELNRINLFAGENNIGKSSLLEAIYLLANQNDINALIEMYRRRGKFVDSLPVNWLVKEFIDFKLEAIFDGKKVTTETNITTEADLSIEKSDYLKTIKLVSSFNGDNPLLSKARLYKRKAMEHFYEEIRSICSVSYSTPFTMLDKELINEYHEISIQRGSYDKIIKFINQYVDSKILNITKVGDSTNQIRFLVNHTDFKAPIDLTQFGEGLQRIFYISLQIASAENGIMCIDEIENAIHHSLLIQFTKFIQILAEEYNVQLFITTHSGECVTAFFENNYRNEQITGYRLYNNVDGIRYKAAKGIALQNQIKNFNLDLRG
ncbi:MAG: ATP-binding protein [Marinifilaceae bacterium]|jgi:predicted ATPase|nr:ATP-binding protein [Marinifilaceae bacterium]